jgi:hypothetical protein
MTKINLTGHLHECISEWADNFIPPNRHEFNYRFRLLLNVNSEVGNIQMPVYSYESKETEWLDDELLSAFNKAYEHLKAMVEKDIEINIFRELKFLTDIKTEKNINDELQTSFIIGVPENTQNYKNLASSLSQIRETQDLFSKCKDKLSHVIGWGNPALKANYYSILKAIDYLSSVVNAAVVTQKSNEYLSNIRSAFSELKMRTITHSPNYQTILMLAKRDIYSLDFPKFFKTNLPYNNEIGEVLDDIR